MKVLGTFAALLLLSGACFAAQALGDQLAPEHPSAAGQPTTSDFESAIAEGTRNVSVNELTDVTAAQELPHHNLGRDEAQELFQTVFEPVLEQTEGVFGEVEPEKLLGPSAALVPSASESSTDSSSATTAVADSLSERMHEKDLANESSDEEEARMKSSLAGDAIVESNLPFKVPAEGGTAPVDLTLSQNSAGITAETPLVPVTVPNRLEEGIELPGSDLAVTLQSASPERAASLDGSNVAFYPNVSADTDFAVAVVPTGFETLTQLRGPDSPRAETLDLSLGTSDRLESLPDGGARIVRDGAPLVSIEAPTAIDAGGQSIPVKMTVVGDSLEIIASPDDEAAYPILIDPLFQSYDWTKEAGPSDGVVSQTKRHEQWSPEVIRHTGDSFILCADSPCGSGSAKGLNATGVWKESQSVMNTTVGDRGMWVYTVPRYWSDPEKYGGLHPTSFIARMVLSNITWNAYSHYPSPYGFMGLWSEETNNWTGYWSHTGQLEHGVNEPLFTPEFSGNGSAIAAYVGVQATEAVPNTELAGLFVRGALIELGDNDVPQVAETGSPNEAAWVASGMVPIEFAASDTGLGVQSVSAFYPSNASLTKKSFGCTGIAGSPCPRKWQTKESSHPLLEVDSSKLPTGEDLVQVQAEDAVGNKSATGGVRVKVDHAGPQISVLGTATEQAVLGTRRPSYSVKALASDGTTPAPQSGVAKEVIELDGVKVAESSAACGQNCSKSLEWSLVASKYAAGVHLITIRATDNVGNVTVQELKATLNPSPPGLKLSGSMTNQAAIGTSRPRYLLAAAATAEAGIEVPEAPPAFASSFGSKGSTNGLFSHPAGLALDTKGNIWVPDSGNNRLEEFNEKGEFLKTIGSAGSGTGQFSVPKSIVFAANGSFWVADSMNSRLEEFNEKGEFLKTIGSQGSGNAQFSGPEALAIDAKGNIWVCDTYNLRIQELNEKGEFIKVVNPSGLGAIEPTGIAVGPGGNVWVSDWAHNRVVEISESGALVRQFGSEGTGNGQFKRPDAVAVDAKGNIWIGDQQNGRVEEFNQAGEYLGQFGSAGTGTEQFSFTYPFGIAVDTKGNLWISDANNNRIQKWHIPSALGYLGSNGATGSGNGQFSHPADVAFDSKGNYWVADRGNNRLEEFSEKGVFIRVAGSAGTTGGKLSSPRR